VRLQPREVELLWGLLWPVLYAPNTYQLFLYVPVVLLKLLIQYGDRVQGLFTEVRGRGILRSSALGILGGSGQNSYRSSAPRPVEYSQRSGYRVQGFSSTS
jgi:hypothetical protein